MIKTKKKPGRKPLKKSGIKLVTSLKVTKHINKKYNKYLYANQLQGSKHMVFMWQKDKEGKANKLIGRFQFSSLWDVNGTAKKLVKKAPLNNT